jgi:hypothetical protein
MQAIAIFVAIFAGLFLSILAAILPPPETQERERARRLADARMNARLLRLNI